MLTKVTSPVLNDEIELKKINGCEISVFAKKNAIPRSNDSGVLDPSWGVGSGGSGAGGMSQSTYDTNADGKVNAADISDSAKKMSTEPSKSQVWGSLENNVQTWANLGDILAAAGYDDNADRYCKLFWCSTFIIWQPWTK